jgi:hypothetical protein
LPQHAAKPGGLHRQVPVERRAVRQADEIEVE